MGVIAPRAFALFLLAFAIAMSIAALADKNWCDNPQLNGGYGKYRIGLRQVRRRKHTRRATGKRRVLWRKIPGSPVCMLVPSLSVVWRPLTLLRLLLHLSAVRCCCIGFDVCCFFLPSRVCGRVVDDPELRHGGQQLPFH